MTSPFHIVGKAVVWFIGLSFLAVAAALAVKFGVPAAFAFTLNGALMCLWNQSVWPSLRWGRP